MNTEVVFTGDDLKTNWFYNKYWYGGANARYQTFAIVLNLLNQRHPNPIIVETGCQRLMDDLGGGMSTSIWAEYIGRYGGRLISVDISKQSLAAAKKCVERFPTAQVELVRDDSVDFLSKYLEPCDLLYLDSFDYPIGQLLNIYGGQTDIQQAIETLNALGREHVLKQHGNIIRECQEHCLKEFVAIEDRLQKDVILLVDDNQLPGGGKPRLLKEYLVEKDEWVCLLDSQATLWIRRI